MARIVMNLRTGEINAMLRGQGGEVVRDLQRRGNAVLSRARQLAPVRTGALRGSLNMQIITIGQNPAVQIGTNLRYAMWVHEGTGIYAGRGYIYPRTARFLSWVENGRRIYARRIRGMRGTPYLLDALSAAAQ